MVPEKFIQIVRKFLRKVAYKQTTTITITFCSFLSNFILVDASCHPCWARNGKFNQICNMWEFPVES